MSILNIVDLNNNQTISGVKTFAEGVDLSNIDILILSGVDISLTNRPTVNGTGVLLSGEASASTLPTTIVYTTGTQTITGSKIFNSFRIEPSGRIFTLGTGLNINSESGIVRVNTNVSSSFGGGFTYALTTGMDPNRPLDIEGRGRLVHGLSLDAGSNNFTNASDHFHLIFSAGPSNPGSFNGAYSTTTSANYKSYQFSPTTRPNGNDNQRDLIHLTTLEAKGANDEAFPTSALTELYLTTTGTVVVTPPGTGLVELAYAINGQATSQYLHATGDTVYLRIFPGVAGIVANTYNGTVVRRVTGFDPAYGSTNVYKVGVALGALDFNNNFTPAQKGTSTQTDAWALSRNTISSAFTGIRRIERNSSQYFDQFNVFYTTPITGYTGESVVVDVFNRSSGIFIASGINLTQGRYDGYVSRVLSNTGLEITLSLMNFGSLGGVGRPGSFYNPALTTGVGIISSEDLVTGMQIFRGASDSVHRNYWAHNVFAGFRNLDARDLNVPAGVITRVSVGGLNRVESGSTSALGFNNKAYGFNSHAYGAHQENYNRDSVRIGATTGSYINIVSGRVGINLQFPTEGLHVSGSNLKVENGTGIFSNDVIISGSPIFGLQSIVIGSASSILGGSGNYVTGISSAIVAGEQNIVSGRISFIGGGCRNRATAEQTFIGGGRNNFATAGSSIVVGGEANCARDTSAAILGGILNIASGTSSTVVGGTSNRVFANYSNITNGTCNTINKEAINSFIGGGYYNTIKNTHSVIGGGFKNCTNGIYANVGGGVYNCATGDSSVVVGGKFNRAFACDSFVGGGGYNFACGPNHSIVVGGNNNIAARSHSIIVGGQSNTNDNSAAFIGGGAQNMIDLGCYGVIVGGAQNTVSGCFNFIGGGHFNCISNCFTTIGGGCRNRAFGEMSFIGGGLLNTGYSSGTAIVGGLSNTASGRFNFIGGGQSNNIFAEWGTIGGGYCNNIANATINGAQTIGGGSCNFSSGYGTTIAGGILNSGNACYVSIGGGVSNCISSNCSTIAGGTCNCIGSSATSSFIGGGLSNLICHSSSVIGGGCNNRLFSHRAVIGGGAFNCITGSALISSNTFHVIGGGIRNFISGTTCNATIGGGGDNTILQSSSSTIGGGSFNSITGSNCATIAGGYANRMERTSNGSFMGGGRCNYISGFGSSILGGCLNSIYADCASILGGSRNLIVTGHTSATILGDGELRDKYSFSRSSLTIDFSSGVYFADKKVFGAVPELNTVTSNFAISGLFNGEMILANSATTITGVIASGNVTGFNTSIIQIGAGQIQITGSGIGIRIGSYNNQYRTAGQFATISLLHTGSNGYIMYGNTI